MDHGEERGLAVIRADKQVTIDILDDSSRQNDGVSPSFYQTRGIS